MKILAASFALATFAIAESTVPVGFNKVTCLSGSDTHVSIPFHQQPVFYGATSTYSDGTFTFATTLSDPTDLTTTPHYLKITSNDCEGKWFDVTAATDTSITVDLNGDTPAITAGDTFKVVPHWTLSTLFPIGNETIHTSSGNLAFQRGTSLLIPDYATAGINKPASAIYFMTASAWIQDTVGYPNADDITISPNSTLIVRHHSGLDATTYTPQGVVETSKSEILLQTSTTSKVDNPIAIDRPVDVALQDLDLGDVFTASSGNLAFQRGDELHVYDNENAALNKPVAKIFYKVGTSWFRDTTGYPSADDEVIKSSEYLVIRKARGDGSTQQWLNSPNY